MRGIKSLSSLRNSQAFMETECILPCSQDASTGPYPETDESTLHNVIMFA
jgi:hypothetical protein